VAFQLFVESVITESHRVFTQCDTLKSYWIFFLALSQKVLKVKSLACIVLHNKRVAEAGDGGRDGGHTTSASSMGVIHGLKSAH